MQQLTDAFGRPGEDNLAAVLLDEHVAAQQKRDEDRAEVTDLRQVDDEAGRRIFLERSQDHRRGLLDQGLVHGLHLRRRDDDGNVAVAFDAERLAGCFFGHDVHFLPVGAWRSS